jgi:Spy/CpxP family protein refolding chaperone
MKNKFILLAFLIVAITFVLLSMASFAEEQGAPTGKPGESFYFPGQDQRPSGESHRHSQQGSGFRKMMDLKLSEEQITEIRQIMLDFQKDSLELNNQIQVKKIEFQELLLESTINMEEVRAKLEEIASLQVEVKVKALENQLKIKEVLTDEQLAELPFGFPMSGFCVRDFEFNRGMKENRW